MRAFFAILCFSLVQMGAAQPGTLDLAFALNGILELPQFTGTGNVACCTQANGRVVLAVDHFTGTDSVTAVVRLLHDGTLDPAFGSAGIALHDVAPLAMDRVADIRPMADGRLLLVVNTTTKGYLCRLLPNGNVDPSFGTNGVLEFQQPGAYRTKIAGCDVDPSGNIAVGLTRTYFATSSGYAGAVLMKLGLNGAQDPAFGSGGQVVIAGVGTSANNWIYGYHTRDVRWRSNGEVIWLMQRLQTIQPGTPVTYPMRYSSTGVSLQPGFFAYSAGSFDQAFVATNNGGAILAAGRTGGTGTGFSIVATSAGNSSSGVTSGLWDLNNSSNVFKAFCSDAQGHFYGAGSDAALGGPSKIRLFRTLPGLGLLDTAFGQSGVVSTELPSGGCYATGVAALPSGKLVAVGRVLSSGLHHLVVAQYNSVSVPSVQLSVRAMLQGPYDPDTLLMEDNLRSAGLIPALEPYTAQGYEHVGGGGDVVQFGALDVGGNNAIVDHAVVELRDGTDPTVIVATKGALIQRDGDVVGMDGISPLAIHVAPGDHHVALRHRNHLGVMSALPISLSAAPVVVDFTLAGTLTYGTAALMELNGMCMLWMGNAVSDDQVKYTGAGNDRDAVLVAVGGSVPTSTLTNVYHTADLNLDGQVKYTGTGNDRDLILQSIGGSTPTSVRTQQLP